LQKIQQRQAAESKAADLEEGTPIEAVVAVENG
jgi:hypothetical protein